MSAPLMPEHAADCAWTLHKWTCSCDHPDCIEAIEAIAYEVIYRCVEWAMGDGVEWADYPDLPEFVWDAVQKKVAHLAEPDFEGYETAYQRLADLATEDA